MSAVASAPPNALNDDSVDLTRSENEAAEESRLPEKVRWAIYVLVAMAAFSERLGIPIGGFSLGLTLPAAYLLLVMLFLTDRLEVDVGAFVIYCAITSIFGVGYIINLNSKTGDLVSVTSLALLYVTYLPFIFVMKPSNRNHEDWTWVMRCVANCLFVGALAGIAQFYVQFVFRAPWLFDISTIIPDALRAQGIYNSAISISGSTYKANGFFFREPSGFSYMMAFGLLIELALFKRRLRMAGFAFALVLSYSGTGILALAIGLLFSLRASTLFRFALVAAVLGAANWAAGDPLNLAFTLSRSGELSSRGSSGYMRYVAPLILVDANIDSSSWAAWLGHGAGAILRISALYDSHDPTWAKLLYEYGLVGFVLMITLLLYKLRRSAVPLQFAAVLFASWFMMGGHLLIPANVYFLFLIGGAWLNVQSNYIDPLASAKGKQP